MTIIYIDDPAVSDPDWISEGRPAPATDAFHLKGTADDHDQQSHAGGDKATRYRGTAAAETERVAALARRGVDASEFDGPVMHRGIAIKVDGELKRRIDTERYSTADHDDFNRQLHLGPIIAEQLLGFQGHQGIERLAGFGQSWTTDANVAESVSAGPGNNLVVKVTARARQKDIIIQEVPDGPQTLLTGRSKFVDAAGTTIKKGRETDLISGEMEVRIHGKTPVDIIDVQIKTGSGWESVWGEDHGHGAGAEELYRLYPSLRDELAGTLIGEFRADPNSKSSGKEISGSHGHQPHGRSILWPAMYEHLRRAGHSKAAAAAISNAAWNEKHGMSGDTDTFHLAGQHDQQTHGNRAGGPSPRARQILADSGERIQLSALGILDAPPALAAIAMTERDNDALWDLPTSKVSWKATFYGTEGSVTTKHVAKVVEGNEAMREGYPPRLYELGPDTYLIADGHHRLAMHSLLESDAFEVVIRDINEALTASAPVSEQFHLKGTADDHDQQSHAGGRISPVSGQTVKKTLMADLTMNGDALTDPVKAKILAQLQNSLGVTPEEAAANLVHMAEASLAKGLPGRDWYQTAHDEAVGAAAGSGIGPDVAVAITAALSPGTHWDRNRDNALHMMEAFAGRDQPLDPHIMKLTNDWGDKLDGSTGNKNSDVNANSQDTFNTLYERDPKVAAVYLAKLANASVGYSYDNFFKATELMVLNDPAHIDRILNGAKVRSFYNNLLEPAGTAGDVTVDVHMQRAMANDTGHTTAQQKYDRTLSIKKKSSTITGSPSQDGAALGAMPVMADAIREATATFNAKHDTDLLPHEFQAVVWVEQISQYPPYRMKELMRGRELSPEVG